MFGEILLPLNSKVKSAKGYDLTSQNKYFEDFSSSNNDSDCLAITHGLTEMIEHSLLTTEQVKVKQMKHLLTGYVPKPLWIQ